MTAPWIPSLKTNKGLETVESVYGHWIMVFGAMDVHNHTTCPIDGFDALEL